jgi:hypothetical protein
VNRRDIPTFLPLTGIYEPSAVQQLPDGRFLVVEDEKEHPLSLVTIGADGTVRTTALTASLFQTFSSFWKLDDLEGLTSDRAGFIYAITSHSRDDDGDDKPSREKLVRFRVEGDGVVDPKVVDGLKQALTARHAVLAAAAKVRDVKARGGLNIEGLEISPAQRMAVAGLRGFEKAEGVCAAVVGGLERLLVVSDDGNRAAKRPANYLLLDPAALRTAA